MQIEARSLFISFTGGKRKENNDSSHTKQTRIASIVAVISSVLLGAVLLPSFWFWVCWKLSQAHLLYVGVSQNVLVEVSSKPGFKAAHRANELKAVLTVSIGVLMELGGLAHAIKEGVKMEQRISELNLRANSNELQAAQLTRDNLVLRSNVAALEDRNKTEE